MALIVCSSFVLWPNGYEEESSTGIASHLAEQGYIKLAGEVNFIWQIALFWTVMLSMFPQSK